MSDDLIAGSRPDESVWRRAGRDTWSSIRTPRFYMAELAFVGTAIISSYIFIEEVFAQVAVPVVAPIILPALVFIVLACRAPFAQRNEARVGILELQSKLKPKLTISQAVVQEMPANDGGFSPFLYDACRIRVANESDAMVEQCTVSLLDIKPLEEWVDFEEGNRKIYGGNEFSGYPDIPLPMSLKWSARDASDTSPSIDVPPRGDSLLDVCYYDSENGKIELAFLSNEMRRQHLRPETDVVFSIRVDSKDCLPVYCVCRYRLNPPIVQLRDQCVIEYIGPDSPNLNDYRRFVQTPRPWYWDQAGLGA